MERQEIFNDSILTIEDYFPIKENTIKEYEGIGNEFAAKSTFVEFIAEGKVQIKEVNPGTSFVKVIEYKNGELKEIYAEGEFYHIENMLNANTNKNNILSKRGDIQVLKRCLIVGADAIGQKKNYISNKFGVEQVIHWDGRSRKIPSLKAMDMIIVLTGFISHAQMLQVKKEAKKLGIKMLYLNRGVAELEKTA